MGQQGRHRYCTAAESAEIWDRWKRGENFTSIGRIFRKSSGSIFFSSNAFWRHSTASEATLPARPDIGGA